ncbi:hypothetical protein [Streptomyces scabiei]|nr:hypothetical protein [Streptomyces scabiei]
MTQESRGEGLVRARPDHALFGPGADPEPTVDDYREITGGDHR